LFENGNTKRIPKHFSIRIRERGLTLVRENDQRILDTHQFRGEFPHFLRRSRNGSRLKALGAAVPSARKNSNAFGLLKAAR
jgi:hypothetical protein